jgi:hypothetical protein
VKETIGQPFTIRASPFWRLHRCTTTVRLQADATGHLVGDTAPEPTLTLGQPFVYRMIDTEIGEPVGWYSRPAKLREQDYAPILLKNIVSGQSRWCLHHTRTGEPEPRPHSNDRLRLSISACMARGVLSVPTIDLTIQKLGRTSGYRSGGSLWQLPHLM